MRHIDKAACIMGFRLHASIFAIGFYQKATKCLGGKSLGIPNSDIL